MWSGRASGWVRSDPRSCGASVTSVTFAIPYSTQRMKPAGASGPVSRSDVQEPDVPRVPGDERAARLDVLAHQHAEQLVGLGRVIERYLQQDPPRPVHRGVPQLARVHLPQALEPLHALPRPRVLAAFGDPGLAPPCAPRLPVGVPRLD